ncbi:MAG: hypothetical protein ACXVAG_00010 [Vulcanimicrobiaceae bacterium]
MIVRRLMLIGVLMTVALASCYAQVPARSKIAPADEYFGRSKMSILEIANRLRDITVRAGRQAGPAGGLMHDTLMTEEAIHDWEHKYPADPWLPRDIAKLIHVYSELEIPAAMSRMHACLAWLQTRYAVHKALVAAERVEVAIADSHLHNVSARR